MLGYTNPALNNDDAFQQFYGDMAGTKPQTATVQGVVNKTAILVGIAVGAGAFGYWVIGMTTSMSIMWISAIAAMGICFGAGLLLCRRPELAKIVAPIYAIVEGIFLGAFTGVLDKQLATMGIVAAGGGLAVQAFVITLGIMLAMLALYSFRILRPTKLFVSVISVLTLGVFIVYALSWVMVLGFGTTMPFVSLPSAFDGGTSALIGLGVNLLILGLASMWLVVDFGMIEEKVASGASRDMEWYCGFALLVSLAWIYYEAVKAAFRLALIFNRE